MFFIAYAFKGQVYVFAGRVKIVSHSSCRTSAKLKYFCPLHVIMVLIVNHLIFAASTFGDFKRLPYWRNLILAVSQFRAL